MKKTLLGLVLLSSTTLFAQEQHDNYNRNQQGPPAEVQNSFQRDNPNVNNANWEQTNNQWHGNYKDNNNRNVDTYYDPTGNRIDTHREIDRRDVPQNVDDWYHRKYKDNGDYRAVRIERPNDIPLFEIRFHKGRRDRIIYMDEHGKKRHYRDRH